MLGKYTFLPSRKTLGNHPDAQRAYGLGAPLVCGKNIHSSNDILYSFPVTSNVIDLRFMKRASFASQDITIHLKAPMYKKE